MAFAYDSTRNTYSDDCRKCLEEPVKEGMFDPQQHRKEWYATYGRQSPISPNVKTRVEYARFIPRSKTTRL